MSRNFTRNGKHITATNMGPDVSVMAAGGALSQPTHEVIQFEDSNGETRTTSLQVGKFMTLTDMELRAIYDKTPPDNAA